MYEIRPDSIKTFISDRSIRLPRFQRKQTWDSKKNFQLCISLFKNYPIGVCILSCESVNGRQVKSLLDGRQRRNALRLLDEDPENLYVWAKSFIGFKPNDSEYDLAEKFYVAISNFLEEDDDEISTTSSQPVSDVVLEEGEDTLGDSTEETDVAEEIEENEENEMISQDTGESGILMASSGIELLLKIIKLIHRKTKNKSGFTAPFDFSKWVNRLEYVETLSPRGNRLISKDLKSFINRYREYCEDKFIGEYKNEESFLDFVKTRYQVVDELRLKRHIHNHWSEMVVRMEVLQQIDDLLSDSKIGVIEVKEMKAIDHQKIFSLINSQGEPLKAVEVLSSKQKWNIVIQNPSQETKDAVRKLYQDMGIGGITNVVRWDLPATFLTRLGTNFIFKRFDSSKPSEFVKGLTIAFKTISGIYTKGVTKENIELLSSSPNVNWEGFDSFLSSVKMMFRIMKNFQYFKCFDTWRTSLLEITADLVAIDFFVLCYLDWIRKGEPIGGDANQKAFEKDCFILIDRLIYEHVCGIWRSSADARIKNNIEHLEENFIPVSKNEWENLLNGVFTNSKINDKDISFGQMKPLLYHFYCLNKQTGPSVALFDTLDVDHIIPQVLFNGSTTIPRKEVVKDNLLNLGILAKENNTSKGSKRLIEITDDWLKTQIKEYEFIEEADYGQFSNVNNWPQLFEKRKPFFLKAYGDKRDDLLNN